MERTFGDNHKVELGKEHSETNGIKLGKMTSSFWVAPDALGIFDRQTIQVRGPAQVRDLDPLHCVGVMPNPDFVACLR